VYICEDGKSLYSEVNHVDEVYGAIEDSGSVVRTGGSALRGAGARLVQVG
jgi:hypothetical protein